MLVFKAQSLSYTFSVMRPSLLSSPPTPLFLFTSYTYLQPSPPNLPVWSLSHITKYIIPKNKSKELFLTYKEVGIKEALRFFCLIFPCETSLSQSCRPMTQLAEKLLSTLPSWRKVTGPNQLMSWQQFVADVQDQINPLVSEEDLRELALQLHSMGEVCACVWYIICCSDLTLFWFYRVNHNMHIPLAQELLKP